MGHIADELIITSNDQGSLDFLCQNVKFGKLRMVSDIYDQRSALNGLYTAIKAASNPYVAVVACDMIFASAPLLLAELEALELSGADAAVPTTSHGYEPFHAVYRRETCLPLIEAALDQGETKATIWYEKARLARFTPEMVLEADPRGGSFVNVNTPQELADMERRIIDDTMTKIANLPATPDDLLSGSADDGQSEEYGITAQLRTSGGGIALNFTSLNNECGCTDPLVAHYGICDLSCRQEVRR